MRGKKPSHAKQKVASACSVDLKLDISGGNATNVCKLWAFHRVSPYTTCRIHYVVNTMCNADCTMPVAQYRLNMPCRLHYIDSPLVLILVIRIIICGAPTTITAKG